MKLPSLLLICIASMGISLWVGSTYYYLSPFFSSNTYAIAVIHPTKGNNVSGSVRFEQQKDGIQITGMLTGLPAGKHGFHIHEFGDCNCDDAICTGGHFNPTNARHGAPTDSSVHIGDMGNIQSDESGNAEYNAMNVHMKLNGPHSIIGRAVIIHSQEDDLVSQPTGNAGARIGCGVIGISEK